METFNFFKKLKEIYAPIVQKELKDHGDNLCLQNVYTPINEIEKATEFKFLSVINNQVKNIAVLFNFEFIEKIVNELDINYINNSKLTFFYDSQYDLNQCKNIVEDVEFIRRIKINIEYISIEDFANSKNIKDLEKVMAQKKFDIIFSNPPYGKKNVKLDLNILQTIFSISKKIVFIHPSTFIFDKKFKWKQYNDIRNTNYLEKIITIWGNGLFNIRLFCPLCISIWNTEKINDEVEVIDNAITKTSYKSKINNVCIHGNSKMIIEFFNKIKQFIKKNGHIHNNTNIFLKKKQTDFSVKFAIIRGNADIIDGWHDDFFSLICKNKLDNYCDHNFTDYDKLANTQKLIWSFNNEIERKNFIIYCKSKIVRFCFSYKKAGCNIANGELEIIPWLDFTQEWNDAKLCKEFGISEELWKYIDNFIPDYYDDYKSGFEK